MKNNCGFKLDNSYTRLPEVFYTRIAPVRVQSPEMVMLNTELAHAMGLDFSGLGAADKAALFAGNKLPDDADPIAQAYAGHQFGHFTMLGDGRAHVWGSTSRQRADALIFSSRARDEPLIHAVGMGALPLGPCCANI